MLNKIIDQKISITSRRPQTTRHRLLGIKTKNLNQAIRRYNQLFSGMMEITIAGDFSLHAGDVIFVDIPAVQSERDDTVNKQSGGLYIIADLCHLVNPDGTWTKLNLSLIHI